MAVQAVAAAWEGMAWIAQQGQSGELVHYTSKNGEMNRRDVVNNADILAPLIAQLGTSAELCAQYYI